MPATTKKQQRWAAMCAHNPGAAKGSCPSKKVAEEFSHKPKGGYKKRKHGGMPKKDANGFY